MKTRRHFMIGAGTLAGAFAFKAAPALAQAKPPAPKTADISALVDDITRIQKESGGRLGVAILDSELSKRLELNAHDRFPMCSTFKLLASAAVLKRVDGGTEKLDRVVKYTKADIVPYTPATEKHIDEGMTLAALCEAAVTLSDNTAGNMILSAIGGPAGFTAFARTLGDRMTRLDRIEPFLNESKPGDPRDTTTPIAMLRDIQELLFGKALSAASKEQLKQWMVANKTGDKRMRAGLPATWEVGDKTGTGDQGSTNDIGVIWPPQRKPILFSIYLTGTTAPPKEREAAIAAIGLAVASALNV
jgi:beta-lactamase class A